jgi:hypothetical protein
MGKVYWLIEMHTEPASYTHYYTCPGTWHNCVNLATKYHTKEAAEAEAQFLSRVASPHKIVAVDHMWMD